MYTIYGVVGILQIVSREEQINRLQSNIHELQDDGTKKETVLQKMERDLMTVEDLRHKTDDSVCIIGGIMCIYIIRFSKF